MKKSLSKISLKAAPDSVSLDDGVTVIKGVSICTAGEARGHGVMLDNSFISECAAQASQLKLGLKARFGHPSMCNEALGTYLGRFKNFSLVDGGSRLIADMHLAESAKSAPGGNLHKYVADRAKEDPESFGTSIVFQMGDAYVIDDDGQKDYDISSYDDRDVYASCKKLFACDFVDEPAANPGGLFSSFHAETVAGQVGMFLEEEPEVLDALLSNPEIVDIIRDHGSKVEEFLSKIKEMNMVEENIEAEEVELEAAEELQEVEAVEVEETEQVFSEEVEEQTEEFAEDLEEYTLSEYRDLVSEFGTAIADRVVDEGGDYEFALGLFVEAKNEEIAALKEHITNLKEKLSFREEDDGDAAEFTDGPVKTRRSLTQNLKL